ncbi:MAG: hypothetical protein QNJ46_12285 [Leptolyngbyaceae cyanobacterium MO_188.B28]|nr:hypothetical protein [Leptolyngbyaceae cyanobacterium MO_188.B28]
MHSRLSLSALSVVYGLMLGLSGCGKSQPQQLETPIESAIPSETLTPGQSPSALTQSSSLTQSDAAASGSRPDASGAETQPATASTAPDQEKVIPLASQSARLTSRDPDATINVRSQPTTQSSAPSYGFPNDPVTLLKKAEGDDGYAWYYVKFDGSNVEGWIRGDFIAAAGGAAASSQTTLEPEMEGFTDINCDSSDQIASFETENYTVDICRRVGGMQYIGIEKGTANSIVIDEVEGLENGFVATSGDTEYIINPTTLMVYQFRNGEYVQLSQEPVIKAERF